MGRRTDLASEMIDTAREVMNRTKEAGELRRALSGVLSWVPGADLASSCRDYGAIQADCGPFS